MFWLWCFLCCVFGLGFFGFDVVSSGVFVFGVYCSVICDCAQRFVTWKSEQCTDVTRVPDTLCGIVWMFLVREFLERKYINARM